MLVCFHLTAESDSWLLEPGGGYFGPGCAETRLTDVFVELRLDGWCDLHDLKGIIALILL